MRSVIFEHLTPLNKRNNSSLSLCLPRTTLKSLITNPKIENKRKYKKNFFIMVNVNTENDKLKIPQITAKL